jgi:hypothetical protein
MTLTQAAARVLAVQRHRATMAERPPVDGGSLPTWLVAPAGKLLALTCPRKDCQQMALVAASWARGGYSTRPCTTCFRTAKVPAALRTQPRHKVPRRRTGRHTTPQEN